MSNLKPIEKIAVIGAGVMGAGIAAQAANGGAEVLLLDIVPKDAENRNVIAESAIERFLAAGSAGGLMHPSVADRITTGNTEDDFAKLADYDWIVEVIIENLEIKQSLYRRIAEVRNPHCIVSSNTSTIPLEKLTEGMPEDFCQHFVITHYFNPPRHMRLVEVVGGNKTLAAVVDRVSAFNDNNMGKTVINCADRPGFIGNRLGVFWMQVALQEALKLGLTVEEADAVMAVCGFPKTGVFGLWDLVGIDLMPSVTSSLASLLEAGDDFLPYGDTVPTVQGMVDKGYFGRKGRVLQGFYRQTKDETGKRIRETIDLDSLEYRAPIKPELASCQLKPGQVNELLACEDKGGQYAWNVLSRTLNYASKLIPEVAHDVVPFDKAMQLGYNWSWGPFQLIDMIGPDNFVKRLGESNIEPSAFLQQVGQRSIYIFEAMQMSSLDVNGNYQAIKSASGIVKLADIKRQPAVKTHSQCAVWDLQDDVWCVEFTARVPALNSELLEQISDVLEAATSAGKALIFYGEGPIFLAGADLKEFLNIIETEEQLSAYIQKGQQLFQRIQDASIPVVGAVAGKALGGGLELLLHCHTIQAHSESALGLVENQVGIVPGWGGCKEVLLRSLEKFGAEKAIAHSYQLIQSCKVTASATEARELGVLRETDGISMNLDRLLFDAKQQALALKAKPFAVPSNVPALPAADNLAQATDGYQATLEQRLAALLNQATDANWYQDFFANELNCNIGLSKIAESKARMEHLMSTGKPLIN